MYYRQPKTNNMLDYNPVREYDSLRNRYVDSGGNRFQNFLSNI